VNRKESEVATHVLIATQMAMVTLAAIVAQSVMGHHYCLLAKDVRTVAPTETTIQVEFVIVIVELVAR
jgi:hypothetical protein